MLARDYFIELINTQVIREITIHLDTLSKVSLAQAIWVPWVDCGAPSPYYRIDQTVYLTPTYVKFDGDIGWTYAYRRGLFTEGKIHISVLVARMYSLTYPMRCPEFVKGSGYSPEYIEFDTTYKIYKHFVDRFGKDLYRNYYIVLPTYKYSRRIRTGEDTEMYPEREAVSYAIRKCPNRKTVDQTEHILQYILKHIVDHPRVSELIEHVGWYDIPKKYYTTPLKDGLCLFEREQCIYHLQSHMKYKMKILLSGKFSGNIRLLAENNWQEVVRTLKAAQIPISIGDNYALKKCVALILPNYSECLVRDIFDLLLGYAGSPAEILARHAPLRGRYFTQYVQAAREKYPEVPDRAYCHTYDHHVELDIVPEAFICEDMVKTWYRLAEKCILVGSANVFRWLIRLAREDIRLCTIPQEFMVRIIEKASKDIRFSGICD